MPSNPQLLVHEIYRSIQGESTWAGLPFIFVRLTGCPLRCTYCDTQYAYHGGTRMSIPTLLDRVRAYDTRHVLVTGGEPLAQPNCLPLLRALCDANLEVLLETAGSHAIAPVDPRVHLIMDLKTPGSGESQRNCWDNLTHLRAERDELKFVLTDRTDYEWAREQIQMHSLGAKVGAILLSPAHGALSYQDLAQWILDDRLPHPIRLQLQLHKHIWGEHARGV